MNEWKSLLNNIPKDWYTNEDYEIQVLENSGWKTSCFQALTMRAKILEMAIGELEEYRFILKELILLPCPFCGSEAELYEESSGCYVECVEGSKCGIGHQEHNWKKKHAIESWNKRI